MLTKNKLREIFGQYGFAPLKKLGANYLIDGNIRDKIIAAADIHKGDVVLEIGPGLGAVTLDLAGTGASVTAVEKDKKACVILGDLAGGDLPNLKIIHKDILEFDPEALAGPKKIKIIGNLPYYITTPVIEYILRNRSHISTAVIMIQKEVASRILAKPGTDDYGSLSCFVQYYAKPEYIYTVKRTCFYPEPEVDSGIVKLDIPDKPSVDAGDEELFFKIVRGAFNQRRKSIINSLARKEVLDMPKDKLASALERAKVDPSARPETLSLADFAKISHQLSR